MALTLADVKDRLERLDETTLLEVLDIQSVDLIERFEDKIIERLEYFVKDLEDEEDEA